jgi:hypothetical protein
LPTKPDVACVTRCVFGPPVGIWTAIDQIPGAKEVVSMVESDHNNRTPEKQGEYTARPKEVLGILLKVGEFKTR